MYYETFLNTLTVRELKILIKKYTSHVKILVTRKTKSELIDHLLTHTELKENKVVTKKMDIGELPKKEVKTKYSEDKSNLLQMEYGDFIPSEKQIKKDIDDQKKRVKSISESDKRKIYSIIKDFSDKEKWKKSTKQEKQLVCYSIYKLVHEYEDKEILLKLPPYLYNYFYKNCEEGKNNKTVSKLKEMLKEELPKK